MARKSGMETLASATPLKRSALKLERAVAAFARPAGKPFPCGLPFVMPGLGAVAIPAPGVPRRADAILAQTRALRDSQARAQQLCRTNPNCPNAKLLFIVQQPRFFLVQPRPRGPAQLFSLLVALWMCVPLAQGPLPGEDYFPIEP